MTSAMSPINALERALLQPSWLHPFLGKARIIFDTIPVVGFFKRFCPIDCFDKHSHVLFRIHRRFRINLRVVVVEKAKHIFAVKHLPAFLPSISIFLSLSCTQPVTTNTASISTTEGQETLHEAYLSCNLNPIEM